MPRPAHAPGGADVTAARGPRARSASRPGDGSSGPNANAGPPVEISTGSPEARASVVAAWATLLTGTLENTGELADNGSCTTPLGRPSPGPAGGPITRRNSGRQRQLAATCARGDHFAMRHPPCLRRSANHPVDYFALTLRPRLEDGVDH